MMASVHIQGVPPLYDFQARAIERALRRAGRGRHTFLAPEQGLGKTRMALTIAERREARRVLVLGPVLGRVVWPYEARQWLPPGLCQMVLALKPDQVRVSNTHDMTIVYVPYDALSRAPRAWRPALAKYQPDILVLDEAHRLGHTDSTRTSAVYGQRNTRGLVSYAELVLPMSGTPARNHVGELWPVLNALAPETIQHPIERRPLSEHEYIERYCKTRVTSWGVQITGSQHVSQLRERTDEFFIRLRALDVMSDLPPIRYVTTPLAMVPVLEDHWPVDLAFAASIPDDELLAWLQAQPLATARRAIGMRKVSAIADWIVEWLAGATASQKLLVFGKHPVVLHAVQSALAGGTRTVLIDGATPSPSRAVAVHDFQHDPAVRVFFGQIDAAGEMLTLTAANTVVIAEAEFVPTVVAQAAKRAHRIGQTQPVLVHLLVAPNTLDARIAAACARKAAELSQMFDDDAASREVTHDA